MELKGPSQILEGAAVRDLGKEGRSMLDMAGLQQMWSFSIQSTLRQQDNFAFAQTSTLSVQGHKAF